MKRRTKSTAKRSSKRTDHKRKPKKKKEQKKTVEKCGEYGGRGRGALHKWKVLRSSHDGKRTEGDLITDSNVTVHGGRVDRWNYKNRRNVRKAKEAEALRTVLHTNETTKGKNIQRRQ